MRDCQEALITPFCVETTHIYIDKTLFFMSDL